MGQKREPMPWEVDPADPMALWNAEAGGFGDELSFDSKSEDAKQGQGDTLGTYSLTGKSVACLLHERASASGLLLLLLLRHASVTTSTYPGTLRC